MRDNPGEGQRSEKLQPQAVASPPLTSLFAFLPPLQLSGGAVRLPLAGRTAADLLSLLATGSPTVADFSAVLSTDGSLALWCLLRASDDKLRTVDGLAAWLSRHWKHVLRWPAEVSRQLPESAETCVDDRLDTLSLCANLAQARITASLAHRLASHAGQEEKSEQARLAGLLSFSSFWLLVSSDQPIHSGVELLPAWLQEATSFSPLEKPAKNSVASFVRQALLISLGKSSGAVHFPWALMGKVRIPAGFAFDHAACDAQRLAIVNSYQQPSVGLDRFPQSIERLARLSELEVDFERRLEFEKIESLKELAYGAGHEINNPLANISARAQTLIKEEADPERRRKLAAIHTQAQRAHEMIAEMMFFARPPAPVLAEVELVTWLEALLPNIRTWADVQGTTVAWSPPTGPHLVRADGAQLAVALRALCSNALEALQTGGEIRLELKQACKSLLTADSPQYVQLAVIDNGPGIEPQVRRHLFDPFFSGREAGRGLGLGLCKCWRIAERHSGSVEVETTPGATRFVISLPLASSASSTS